MRWLGGITDPMRHESEQTPEIVKDTGKPMCGSPWGHDEPDTTEWLNKHKPYLSKANKNLSCFLFIFLMLIHSVMLVSLYSSDSVIHAYVSLCSFHSGIQQDTKMLALCYTPDLVVYHSHIQFGFQGGSVVKDLDLPMQETQRVQMPGPWSEDPMEEWNGNPFHWQHNPMARHDWQATVHREQRARHAHAHPMALASANPKLPQSIPYPPPEFSWNWPSLNWRVWV